MTKFLALFLRLGLVLVLAAAAAGAEVKVADKESSSSPLAIEQSTESPIADMALIGRQQTNPKIIEPLPETS